MVHNENKSYSIDVLKLRCFQEFTSMGELGWCIAGILLLFGKRDELNHAPLSHEKWSY